MAYMKKKKYSSLPSVNVDEKLFTVLDVGCANLRLSCGYVGADKLVKIVGYLERPSKGLSRGSITDLNELASSIASLIQDFQNMYDITIKEVVTGVPGCFIYAENHNGTAMVQSGKVTINDRNNAISTAKAGVNSKFDENYTTIHLVPQYYRTESANKVQNPIGMFAKRLDVNVHVIGCNTLHMKNIENALLMASREIHMKNMIYEGIAASSAVLLDSEKDIGVIHIDMGAGTTSVSVFEGNRHLISFGIDDAGDYITRWIAKAFAISPSDAEYLKCNFGLASPSLLREEEFYEPLPLLSEKGQMHQEITRYALCSYINRALVNMFNLILKRVIDASGAYLDKLNIGAGVVLSGGTAKLPGIERVFSQCISQMSEDPTCRFISISPKVRIGHPRLLSIYENACDQHAISDTDKAVVVGLLRAARFENLNQYIKGTAEAEHESGKVMEFFKKAAKWMDRELF